MIQITYFILKYFKFLIGTLICLNLNLYSQINLNTNSIKIYDANNGLPNNSVQSSFQDSLGFIWISTAETLVRFDGKNFTNYYPNAKDSTSVSGSSCFSFAQTSKEEIWLVHNKGISIYSQSKNNFRNVLKTDGAFDNKNLLLGFDKNNYMWALIINKGLVKINTETQKIESIIKIPVAEFYYPNYYIVPSGVLFNNKIYFSVLRRSYFYDLANSSFNLLFQDSLDIRCWLPIRKNELLLGGVNVLMKGNEKEFVNLSEVITKQFSMVNFQINELKQYSDSTLLIAGKNLFAEVTLNTFKLKQSIQNISIDTKPKALLVQSVMKDSYGNYWLGLNGHGLIKFPYNQKQIYSLPLLENGNQVKAIRADNKYIFTGYFADEMSVYDRQNNKLEKVSLKKIGNIKLPPENTVYALEIIDSNAIFVSASFFGSSAIYNIKSKEFRSLREEILKLVPYNSRENQIYKFAIRTKNNTVLFNHGHTIFTCEMKNGRPIVHLYGVIEQEALTTAYQDKDSNLWIGSEKNLYFAKGNSKHFQKIHLPSEQTIKSITQSKTGEYWIASVNGIFVLNNHHALIKHFTRRSGLLNDYVYSVLCDENNNIWFSSNKGIGRYDYKSNTIKNYTVEDGLQGNEFNTNAYYQSESGELFFGGGNGVNYFRPDGMHDNQRPAVCRISEIKLGDIAYQPDSAIWVKKHLQLEYINNTISFTFFGSDFKQPETTEFAYYLDGYEKDWIQNKNNNFVRYPNLPPGKYLLKYKCTNGDAIWSENFSQLAITILPPWYKTTWAMLLFTLGGLLIIVTVFYAIIRRRDEKQQIKLNELKKIQEERNRISRDLHDNVGSLVSFVSTKIDWIIKNKTISEDTSEDLKLVKDNAGEIMSGLRETIWTLNHANLTNADLADKLKYYIKVHLLVKYEIEDSIIEEQSIANETVLSIYRCCQEVINNINKHSQANLVKIKISGEEKCKFRISIYDDGIGIKQSDFEKNDHHGLRNIKSRLNEVGVMFECNAESGKGTQIIIAMN